MRRLSVLPHSIDRCTRRYLKSDAVGAISRLDYVLPDVPQDDIYVVDTAELFAALEGEESNDTRSLETICRHLRIPTKYLHNAGNDAHVRICPCCGRCVADVNVHP